MTEEQTQPGEVEVEKCLAQIAYEAFIAKAATDMRPAWHEMGLPVQNCWRAAVLATAAAIVADMREGASALFDSIDAEIDDEAASINVTLEKSGETVVVKPL